MPESLKLSSFDNETNINLHHMSERLITTRIGETIRGYFADDLDRFQRRNFGKGVREEGRCRR